MAETKKNNHILIVLKPTLNRRLHQFISNIFYWLKRRKKEVYFLEKDRTLMEKILSPTELRQHLLGSPEEAPKLDLVISLGGDGTFIGVCHLFAKNTPPIFGVNLGHLGFITEFTMQNCFEELDLYFKNGLETYTLPKFNVSVFQQDQLVCQKNFINDVVFSKYHISRLFTVSIEIDDEHINDLAGDGVIISSPIGSTAYSLAAGGPIVPPDVKALILTPICPHTLTQRPVVLKDNCELRIKLAQKTEAVSLTLDGQQLLSFSEKQVVIIKKDPHKKVRVVKSSQKTYFQTLKEKFFIKNVKV